MASSSTAFPRLPFARALVTGGAGFIGSHLSEHLLQRGCAVHVLDDLSAGSLQNLAHLSQLTGLRVTVASATQVEVVERALADVDAVFHLAGAVGVPRLHREPVDMLTRNLQPTETVLAAAARRRVPVLVASSSEVYGAGPVPFRESDPVRTGSVDSLRGGYACAKAMGEWLALAHARQHELPVVVARIFNCVGPRQAARHGMVLPRFLGQARRGEPITVYGDGRQTRCFAHVHDTARALAELLARSAAHGQVCNVGSDREIAIAELAAVVQRCTGSRSPIVHLAWEQVFPPGLADLPRRVPCLDRLRRLLGWVPDQPIAAIVEGMCAEVALPASPA